VSVQTALMGCASLPRHNFHPRPDGPGAKRQAHQVIKWFLVTTQNQNKLCCLIAKL